MFAPQFSYSRLGRSVTFQNLDKTASASGVLDPDTQTFTIQYFEVDSNCRRQGLGRQLALFLIAEVRRSGATKTVVDDAVDPDSGDRSGPLAFWTSLGFKFEEVFDPIENMTLFRGTL